MDTEKQIRKLTPEATINQIISTDRNAADLLTSIGMKPEQFLDQTLRSACQQLQWNEEELLNWIKKHRVKTECIEIEPEETESKDDLVLLCNQMLEVMQPCIYEGLAEITKDLPRVQLIHGNQYTQLKNIEWHFKKMNELVNRYLLFEQKTLIPLAKELKQQEQSIQYGKAKNLERAITLLEDNRGNIKQEMDKIRQYSNSFQHPAGACSTFRIMNKNMADLDRQLTKYFSIEENQLFPAIENLL